LKLPLTPSAWKSQKAGKVTRFEDIGEFIWCMYLSLLTRSTIIAGADPFTSVATPVSKGAVSTLALTPSTRKPQKDARFEDMGEFISPIHLLLLTCSAVIAGTDPLSTAISKGTASSLTLMPSARKPQKDTKHVRFEDMGKFIWFMHLLFADPFYRIAGTSPFTSVGTLVAASTLTPVPSARKTQRAAKQLGFTDTSE
jgi:hypothetical protein